jgi:D-mannonate dehydratase
MIAITTENGTLRIVGELAIPNGQNWSPGRIQRLMMEIERYVFTAELVDKDLPKSNGRIYTSLPERKPNFKSGLVIDA